MRAGTLRHLVTIQEHSTSQDSYGEPDKTWSDIDTVWADVKPMRGQEYIEARGEQAALFYLVTMRAYRTVLSQFTHRLQFTDAMGTVHTLDIDEPPEDVGQRDRTWRLRCREQL